MLAVMLLVAKKYIIRKFLKVCPVGLISVVSYWLHQEVHHPSRIAELLYNLAHMSSQVLHTISSNLYLL